MLNQTCFLNNYVPFDSFGYIRISIQGSPTDWPSPTPFKLSINWCRPGCQAPWSNVQTRGDFLDFSFLIFIFSFHRWGDWRPHLAMILSNPLPDSDINRRFLYMTFVKSFDLTRFMSFPFWNICLQVDDHPRRLPPSERSALRSPVLLHRLCGWMGNICQKGQQACPPLRSGISQDLGHHHL